MNVNDLIEQLLAPAKEDLKKSLFNGMDDCARMLVVTRRIGELANIFDSATYTDILNRYATQHFIATKGMNIDDLVAYLNKGERL